MMSSRTTLERECRTFTRYLAGHEPTEYVLEKYCDAHVRIPALAGTRFDRRLAAVARVHPALTLATDAYIRFFAPHGGLRKKLVLLLAILEISPPFFRVVDRPRSESLVLQLLGLAAHSICFALALPIGVICFLPLQLLSQPDRGGNA